MKQALSRWLAPTAVAPLEERFCLQFDAQNPFSQDVERNRVDHADRADGSRSCSNLVFDHNAILFDRWIGIDNSPDLVLAGIQILDTDKFEIAADDRIDDFPSAEF